MWVLYECQLFSSERTVTDHLKFQMIQLCHRLRLATILILQLAHDDKLKEFIDGLNQYDLIECQIMFAPLLKS